MLERHPSLKLFSISLGLTLAAALAVGYTVGALGFSAGAALMVATILVLIAVPLLIKFAPKGFLGRSDR